MGEAEEGRKMTNDEKQFQLLFLEFRKAADEYVAAVDDTTQPLHNREECNAKKPCAFCRRRWKAEDRLLELVGRRGQGLSQRAYQELKPLLLKLLVNDTGKSPKM